MEKSNEIKLLLAAIGILSLLTISSCKKNTSDIYKDILGTWISTDLVDTVEFRTDHDFFKTVGVPKDHFNYEISRDSITIQYEGALYVRVQPTNHYYHLSDNILIIDLNNSLCYGFRSQMIIFKRK